MDNLTAIEKTAATYGPVTSVRTAGDLALEHIGSAIHFAWTQPVTQIHMLVTGELREIIQHAHYDGTGAVRQTTIWLMGLSDTVTGDKSEFVLHADELVAFIQD